MSKIFVELEIAEGDEYRSFEVEREWLVDFVSKHYKMTIENFLNEYTSEDSSLIEGMAILYGKRKDDDKVEITIKKKLEDIKSVCGNDLIERVIDDALEHGDDAESWLEDVRQHGCQSGSVSGLIYYSETHEFFIEFNDEIQDAFFEYSEQVGEQPKIPEGDIRNWFSWFGYEWAVGEVLNKLENYDPSEFDQEEEEEEELEEELEEE